MRDSDPFKPLIASLQHVGYAILPAFFDAPDIEQLAHDCRALNQTSALLPAAVGRGINRRHEYATRGDRTHWFDPLALTKPQVQYWQIMETLRVALNQSLLLGLSELEAHYALYPPGKIYARHRDRFRNDDARVLSSVCYLNVDWCESDGGALRLYLNDGASNHLDIYPKAGTLVLFLSAEFEHEVLPASRERLSIAGWFKQRTIQPF